MRQASLLHVLVGSGPIATDDLRPTLIIDAEPERLDAVRQNPELAEKGGEWAFQQAVLASTANRELVWFRYSDDRFNGLVPLDRWREFFPNLHLRQEDRLSSQTLADILSQWPAARDTQQAICLTLSQGDPLEVLKGASAWLPRIQHIALRGPKAKVLWLESCAAWLAEQGFDRDPKATLSWTLDPRAAHLMRQKEEIEALKAQLSASPSNPPLDRQAENRQDELTRQALALLFPYAAYRTKRPDLAHFSDPELLNHYISYGIHEGVDLEFSHLLQDWQQSTDLDRELKSPPTLPAPPEREPCESPLIDAIETSLPTLSPPEEIRMKAWLVANHVYVTLPEAMAKTLVPVVCKGTSCFAMKEVGWSQEILNLLSARKEDQLFSSPNRSFLKILDQERDNHFLDSGINLIPNYSVSGGETLHIHLSDAPQIASLPLIHEFSITSSERERWSFEALLAVHRAKGKLEIVTTHQQKSSFYCIDFQPEKAGGTSENNFLRARLEFPLEEGITRLTVRLIHGEFVPHVETDNDSYYFIANPILRCCGSWKKYEQKNLEPRPLKNGQECTTEDILFSALVSPFSSREDSSLILKTGNGKAYELFSPLAAQVRLKAIHSHTLILDADPSGAYSLFVNGRFCDPITIGAEATPVPLPDQWLRGEPVEVEVRDSSGSQIFACHSFLAPRFLTPENILLAETRAPIPTNLTVRANHRYQALRQHLSQPLSGVSTEMLLRALDVLDRNHDTLKRVELAFPVVSEPEVSIIIPAHNKFTVTFYCLSALLLAHNKVSFEVILVDDGSSDETADIERWIHGIRVIHNEQALRFIKACNQGVREAKGKFVVLLNNDTEVTVGWLDALVDAFDRFENVGAVGSKLLYPDGRLQDAGGIIWGSGNPWNYGHGMNPWDPRFSYARQVDYLSGAALMTTKEIWDEVGGLSPYLEPMYFEDTDFSFKIREAGYTTYVVPSSVVYHFEGLTSGTDTSTGLKQFQEINRPKFKRCWAKAFRRNGEEGVQPDLEKDRGIIGRILFIDYTTPREDQDAGSYAAIREIKLIQSLGYKVTFLPQNLFYLGSYTDDLMRDGVEVITAPFHLSVASLIIERANEFDAAYITRYNVARETVDLIRSHSPRTRILLNNADLHFLRELRAALISNDQERMENMRIVREQELEIMRQVDLVLSYNEVEHTLISSYTDGQVKVMACPWVVDLPDEVAPLSQRKGLSFIGNFNHLPNAEAVKWFCQNVMPLLEEQSLTLTIYGSSMGPDVKELESDYIHPVGYIESVDGVYQRHRVFIAPLLSGAGVKGKVVSALAYGIPTVLTPIAAEGIGLRHGYDCMIARRPEEWLTAITQLCSNDDLWKAISDASRSYAASQFSFAAGKEKIKAALEAVDLYNHLER